MADPSAYKILTAPTGSGKTVDTPLWFAERGFRVLVVEPLIETVLGTSEYVAEITGTRLGEFVGYATAEESCYGKDTMVLYATTGLGLMKTLLGSMDFDVLIIDEFHEKRGDQSLLEAHVWKQILQGTCPFQYVLVESATMDTATLSSKRNNAPVFVSPGRAHEIEVLEPGESIEADAARMVREGRDVLIFQPGWKAIQSCIATLRRMNVDAEILPFHSGNLSREEKDRVYQQYHRPKIIVSTNGLETGRTPTPSKPGRELAVIDSGMEYTLRVVDGFERLILQPIAQSKGLQRKGRTGRVGKGYYIDHCPTPWTERPQYPLPEIQTTDLDRFVLLAAAAGEDIEHLPFCDELPTKEVADAKGDMIRLGLIDPQGHITKLGQKAMRLPCDPHIAVMLLEGAKRGVADRILKVGAILQTGSLKQRGTDWQYVTGESRSDVLAELSLWDAAEDLVDNGQEQYLRDAGVFAPNFWKARHLAQELRQRLGQLVSFSYNGTGEDLLKAVISGLVDHVYHRGEKGRFGWGWLSDEEASRELDRKSVVDPDKTQWVVGRPFDLQLEGGTILNLITWVTDVDPRWLPEVAPHLATTQRRNERVEDGKTVCDLVTIFDGQEINVQVGVAE